MSRIARNNYNASFFHIMVQGLNKEYIFNDNTMNQFKELFKTIDK